MIRIRLRRVGKKRQPYYRVVVADKPVKRDGAFLAVLGSYDPHSDPPSVQIDEVATKEWLGKGAQPSESAHKVLVRAGILPPIVKPAPSARAAARAKAQAPSAGAAKAGLPNAEAPGEARVEPTPGDAQAVEGAEAELALEEAEEVAEEAESAEVAAEAEEVVEEATEAAAEAAAGDKDEE